MKTTFQRIIILATFSLGIALLFFPYHETRHGFARKKVITIEKDTSYNSSAFAANDLIKIAGPEFNPDDFPQLWDVLINLEIKNTVDSISLNTWKSFLQKIHSELKSKSTIVFHDQIIDCTVPNKNDSTSVFVYFRIQGHFDTEASTLNDIDFKDFSKIKSKLDSLINSFKTSTTFQNIKQWNKFRNEKLNANSFYYKGTYFAGYTDFETQFIEGRVFHLKLNLKLLGILILMIGFARLFKIKKMQEIYWGKQKRLFRTNDFISLPLFILSAFLLVNNLLASWFYITPSYNNNQMLIIGTFFWVFGLLFFPLLTGMWIKKQNQNSE